MHCRMPSAGPWVLLILTTYLLKVLSAEPYFYLHQRPRWLQLLGKQSRQGEGYSRTLRSGPPALEAPALRSGPLMALEAAGEGGPGGYMADAPRTMWRPSGISEARPRIGRLVEVVFPCTRERATCNHGGKGPVILYDRGDKSLCACFCPVEFRRPNCEPL